MITLESVKLFLRIDSDDENELLEHLISVAESYLIDGVTDYQKNYLANENYQKKADLLKKILVSEMYNNRDPANDKRNNFSYTVQSMLNQLRYFTLSDGEVNENNRELDSK